MERVYKVSAFSEGSSGGNKAGVMLNADELSSNEMLKIAANVGFSETAFVMESSVADFKVRFFTPVDEVDLCGHATIATFNLMRDLKLIAPGQYTQETKAGVLKLFVSTDSVMMEQNVPTYYEEISNQEIKACFESDGNFITELPAQVVSTGLKDIMLPVTNLEILHQLKPNLNEIVKLSEKYEVTGIHAFCFETISGHQVHARNFAPLYGIDEESATGTSNGAMVGYLFKHCNNRYRNELIIEQGHIMNEPSLIKVHSKNKNNQITSILVGGSARRI